MASTEKNGTMMIDEYFFEIAKNLHKNLGINEKIAEEKSIKKILFNYTIFSEIAKEGFFNNFHKRGRQARRYPKLNLRPRNNNDAVEIKVSTTNNFQQILFNGK